MTIYQQFYSKYCWQTYLISGIRVGSYIHQRPNIKILPHIMIRPHTRQGYTLLLPWPLRSYAAQTASSRPGPTCRVRGVRAGPGRGGVLQCCSLRSCRPLQLLQPACLHRSYSALLLGGAQPATDQTRSATAVKLGGHLQPCIRFLISK